MNYPKKRSKTFDEAYARCNTQKVTKRWMRRCWLRDVGLQINTNTNRSRAWKFRKFVFWCSVLVPNRWMWSSEHIIVGCFWISLHPQLNFLLVEETLPLWQTIEAMGRGPLWVDVPMGRCHMGRCRLTLKNTILLFTPSLNVIGPWCYRCWLGQVLQMH